MKQSHSAGAIGILGVKKTVDGVYLYFAHNTDSFVSALHVKNRPKQADRFQAVASMGTNDKEPRSVMSRGKGDSQVVHGARVIKHHRWRSGSRGTWPADAKLENLLDTEPEWTPAAKRRKTKRASKERVAKTPTGFNPPSSIAKVAKLP